MKMLVIVDMQNDFISGSLGSPEAQKAYENLLVKMEKNEYYDGIFFTQDTHNDDYMETLEGKHLPVTHCIEGTFGWCVPSELYTLALESGADRVFSIPKPTFGSMNLFTTMDGYFDIEDDITIEFVGLCTDICVISNALLAKAYFIGNVEVIVDASCCAGVTPEKHAAALDVMKSCQVQIINE